MHDQLSDTSAAANEGDKFALAPAPAVAHNPPAAAGPQGPLGGGSTGNSRTEPQSRRSDLNQVRAVRIFRICITVLKRLD